MHACKGPFFEDEFETSRNRRVLFDFHNEQFVNSSAKVHAVFYGDSITELWAVDSWFQSSDGLLVNRGIAGDRLDYMHVRFFADVHQLCPDYIVFLGGINDIAQLLKAGTLDDNIVEILSHRWEDLKSDFLSLPSLKRVFWGTLLPVHWAHTLHLDLFRLVNRLNPVLARLCDSDKLFSLVDYASDLSDENGRMLLSASQDGLHPTASGYRIMTDSLCRSFDSHSVQIQKNIHLIGG